MSLITVLRDGRGTNSEACVDGEGAVLTSVLPYPPKVIQQTIPFRQHLTDDGLATDGSNQDMTVDGSTTNVDFYIGAHQERDRYITNLSFLLEGSGATLKEFCTASALTNGCQLMFNHAAVPEVYIHDSLKSNWDFVRLARGNPAFGTGGDAFRAKNVFRNLEGFMPVLDLSTMSPSGGIKLDAGSVQRLTLRIRDDLTVTGIDTVDCIAYGYERF